MPRVITEYKLRRFWARVDKNGQERPGLGQCWLWNGSRQRRGYGTTSIWREGRRRTFFAHRIAYELVKGEIAEGLELDHLCKNPRCVNPHHLEAVTHQVNMVRGNGFSGNNARKTHCPMGHPLSGRNLYRHPNGGRNCKICKRRAFLEFQKRKRAKEAPRNAGVSQDTVPTSVDQPVLVPEHQDVP